MLEPVDFVDPTGEGVARVSCGLVDRLLLPDPPELLPALVLLLPLALQPLRDARAPSSLCSRA